jgi:hypothetical protein
LPDDEPGWRNYRQSNDFLTKESVSCGVGALYLAGGAVNGGTGWPRRGALRKWRG